MLLGSWGAEKQSISRMSFFDCVAAQALQHNKEENAKISPILTDAQTSRLRQSSSLYPEPPCLVLGGLGLGSQERHEVESACVCAHVSEIIEA